MAQTEILWRDNDCLLRITGIRGAANGVYLNAADVQVTLTDDNSDTEIAGLTWPQDMSWVVDSDGVYELLLPHTLMLSDSQSLWAEIIADGGPGLYLTVNQPVLVSTRLGD